MAVHAEATTVCESSAFAVDVDFPGGKLDACVALEHRLIGEILPEDKPPINPSPWYSFKIETFEADAPFELEIELNYPPGYQHRYLPKRSSDGITWSPLPQGDISVSDDGSVHFSVTVETGVLYISAQENLNLDWYREWIEELKHEWHDPEIETIGYSIARHPIKAIETSSDASNVILLIGRAHPPEVPGAMAMREFVRALATIRREACLEGLTSDCRFFQRHNFLIVPLLNPDGVALGHWRHNLDSTDLNRDWGPFTQPETTAVINKLESMIDSSRLQLMLDFHSTNRDVLYIQESSDETDPKGFTEVWLKNAVSQFDSQTQGQSAVGYEIAPRPTTENGTTKNYFYSNFGIPAITFETGDNTDRSALPRRMFAFAHGLVRAFEQLGESNEQGTLQSTCGYTYSRSLPCNDFYCFLIEANKASLVVFADEGRFDIESSSSFAQLLLGDLADADEDESLRVQDYLRLENRLIQHSGPEISNVHIGRSRQDLHGTVRRMLARDRWMGIHARVNRNRKELLRLAETHLETIIPAYTHGVPSQPTTFGHQLLAYEAALGRTSSRLHEGFDRLNRSPYGAGTGTTSGFFIDRERIATLLGFNGPVDNSFDANFVDSMNYKNEFAGVLSDAALSINQFVANIHSQQRDPFPWIYLGDSSVSSSSSMPQKRNPRDLDRLRAASNHVLALANRLAMNSHNVDAGMHDYRMASNTLDLADAADVMFDRFTSLLQVLFVDPERAQAEIERSFATSAQVADLLVENSDVSFREAQMFAAALVNLARSTERQLTSLKDDEIEEVFSSTLEGELPVKTAALRHALNSSNMVFSRKGLGGPQMEETVRMVNEGYENLARDLMWYKTRQTAITSADVLLQDAFYDVCSKRGAP